MNEDLKRALLEIENHLANGIIPFWLENGFDEEFGGFLTCFDSGGNRTSDTNKYIVTQTRMIWGLSALYAEYPENEELIKMAKKGVDFFIEHFWDKENLGWFWKVSRDGTLIDDGKVVYGQSFALYALAQYAKVTGDEIVLNYAEKTFDLLQKYCADTLRGGYYENLENDWSMSESGFAAGDRKSLDIHMHLMEAFTVLADVTHKEIHKRKLAEVMDLILNKMVNNKYGCGLNQFDLNFNPIPAIDIRRTWNAERATGETIETPTDTTSYGHNVELAWLLNYASDILGRPFNYYNEIVKKLTDHSLKYGFDYEFGGIYRDGAHDGEALVYDKEFWQNSECLVGYLNAYERLGDSKYLEAFYKTWQFDSKYFINHERGEWRQLLTREGRPIVSDLGNPWKAIYHSGRSLLESKKRLTSILKTR